MEIILKFGQEIFGRQDRFANQDFAPDAREARTATGWAQTTKWLCVKTNKILTQCKNDLNFDSL